VAATHHPCGSRTLPRRPCVRMLTPLPRLERTGSSVGCSPAPQRPSPYGRRVGSSEKLSRPAQGSRAFRPAHLHLGCTEESPGGFSRTITRARLLQWLPGEPTIPRTGLPPAGLRDPGGLSVELELLSSHQTSFRAALPCSSQDTERNRHSPILDWWLRVASPLFSTASTLQGGSHPSRPSRPTPTLNKVSA